MLHYAAPSVDDLYSETDEEDFDLHAGKHSRPIVILDPVNPFGSITAPSFLELQAKGGPDIFIAHDNARAGLLSLSAATNHFMARYWAILDFLQYSFIEAG